MPEKVCIIVLLLWNFYTFLCQPFLCFLFNNLYLVQSMVSVFVYSIYFTCQVGLQREITQTQDCHKTNEFQNYIFITFIQTEGFDTVLSVQKLKGKNGIFSKILTSQGRLFWLFNSFKTRLMQYWLCVLLGEKIVDPRGSRCFSDWYLSLTIGVDTTYMYAVIRLYLVLTKQNHWWIWNIDVISLVSFPHPHS